MGPARVTAKQYGWQGLKQNTGAGEGHHKTLEPRKDHCKTVGPVRFTAKQWGLSGPPEDTGVGEGHHKTVGSVRVTGRHWGW